ncbi:MAG: 4-hydroxy-tetrahydrodipicolinate reductase [Chloroflexota bacterium]
MPIKVVVNGARGRMGREVLAAVCREPDLKLVGAVELAAAKTELELPDNSGSVPFSSDLAQIIAGCQPDVVVDFTNRDVALRTARLCLEKGVSVVIGTTGLTVEEISEIDRLARSRKVGAVVAPNFALGAVLMMHMAKLAARYFDYAEIIELHHQQKIDAPSGTALMTARLMSEARGKPFERTGGDNAPKSRGDGIGGISLHSVRLPGLVAHQEVLLGGLGQTLSIRHDSISRESFMPGVVLAIREVTKRTGLVYGLDTLLGL